MKRISIKSLCLIALLCFTDIGISQEIPPIQVFTPQDYNAEDQNWAITQSPEKFIYTANNEGLLEYNGATWQLYKSPNGTIVRSVLASTNLIYTGLYMDFGYWSKNEVNILEYTSLVSQYGIQVKEDEEFWGILELDNYIIFQSFERVYICNRIEASCKIIEGGNRINKIFKVGDTIYFQDIGKGIYRIENGEAKMLVPSNSYGADEIIKMFNSNGDIILVTKNSGLLRYRDTEIVDFLPEINNVLKGRTVYSALNLRDGSLVLGTISNGIIQVNPDGEILLEINQTTGLSNNTILALHEDVNGNIWLGLDNGINVINLKSPIRVYTDKFGQLGTIYAAIEYKGYLYLGTNQGLFYRLENENAPFSLIPETNGQIWSLNDIDGTLFCGHDNGTFIIEQNKAKLIASIKGTWGIKAIPSQSNLLIQGNYKGLHILERKNQGWAYKNKLEGFDISSRYFEFVNDTEILVSHEYKGVYRLSVDKAFSRVNEYANVDVPAGIKSSITSYKGDILYAFNDGVYKYEAETKRFKKDSIYSEQLSYGNYHSGKLIVDKDENRLWAFSKNNIVFIEPGQMSTTPEINAVAIPEDLRKDKAGFENILNLNNKRYLVGSTTGYFVLDLSKIENYNNQVLLNSAVSYDTQDYKQYMPIVGEQKLSREKNNIKFTFSVPIYNEYSRTQYQYKLEGLYDTWSNWSLSPVVAFENLPHGNYNLEVRAKSDGILSSNVLSYRFSIDKPLYLKPLAISAYVIAFLSILFLMHYINRSYYKRQKTKLLKEKERERELEKLENQKELVEIKNENLQLDIENKNRELGIATMNLVKRNELLSDIKTSLVKVKTIEDIKKVTIAINNNLNDSNDWKLFEEAFNNVDKDFMKRVKILHPSVTPNDLRLCAYLRLNLSSKEIAPLLNISHKSVEVKRYRLRKKMGLEHDKSLTNYILEL